VSDRIPGCRSGGRAARAGIASQIVQVIEHCGLVFVAEPPAGAPAGASERLVYLGDDAEGRPLE